MANDRLPRTAVTESAALRMLDWPTSRRALLRERVSSIPLGPHGRVYDRREIERLAADPQAAEPAARSADPASRFTRPAGNLTTR